MKETKIAIKIIYEQFICFFFLRCNIYKFNDV